VGYFDELEMISPKGDMVLPLASAGKLVLLPYE
jgi:hypothetical protein